MMCWLQRFSLYKEHYTEVGIAEATVGIGQECQESFETVRLYQDRPRVLKPH